MSFLRNKNSNDKKSSNKYLGNLFTNMPYLELTGNREVLLEGCKGIVEYTTDVIRINAGSMMIVFLGRGLNIKCLSPTGLVIDGYITAIEFVS